MEHAWLDSLSEDWVSQPGSDDSGPKLPSPEPTANKPKPRSPDAPSRIPRRAMGPRSSTTANNDANTSALSERSANEINKSMQRIPSKLSQEVKIPPNGSNSRCASGSTNGSVVHNTVQHQSPPGLSKGATPEWKRRLVYGDVQYGEQRDLFCSAAAGLQDMFRPPPTNTTNAIQAEDEELQHDETMPSSPPINSRRRVSVELEQEVNTLEEQEEGCEYPNDVSPSPSPRRIQRDVAFRLNAEGTSVMDTPSNMPTNRRAVSHVRSDGNYRDESCLSAPSGIGADSRKISGQSDTRNEDFSPILIGKHNSEEGKVDFAPVEVPADELKQKLERLRINQVLFDSQADLEAELDGDENEPNNMDATLEYERRGAYINFRRGGRSEDGSFRHRGLSPGFGVDTSEMLPEESLQASTPKQFPTVRAEPTSPFQDPPSPTLPRAPFPSPEKTQAKAESQRGPSSGSPLKLFGPYDTFTNQTLLRRISQFEEGVSGTTSGSMQSDGHYGVAPSGANQPFVDSPGNPKGFDSLPWKACRSVSGSGARALEGYQFNGEISNAADDESQLSNNRESVYPRAPSLHPPIFNPPQRESSPEGDSEMIVRRKRDKSMSSSAITHNRSSSLSGKPRNSVGHAHGALDASAEARHDSGPDGKRPRTSPSKDPTPKRRRTLHRSDIAFGREHLAGVECAHEQIQSVMGRQRNDSQRNASNLAEPHILGSRSILRARTPSASLKPARKLQDDGKDLSPVDQPKISPSRNDDENRPQSSHTPMEGERKPSIRTQDFVDQAAQIMAMIRSQVRPPGLASVEESGAEDDKQSPGLSDFGSESTREPFSRPPSREGKPSVSRAPQWQEDPELANRLKKYQEVSDMGDVISSSMRSVSLAKDAIRAAQEVEHQINETSRSRSSIPLATDDEVISDIPNVRISTNPSHGGLPASPSRDFPTDSSGQSTNRSYPTGSSKGSESRRTIMPESVSHLIPERVGSMRLDKDNNIWVKNKGVRPAQAANLPPSDSDEDPFASIADLSVDLTKEMQNLRLNSARKEGVQIAPELRDPPESPTAVARDNAKKGYVTLSPEGQMSPAMATLAQRELRKLGETDSHSLDSALQDEVATDSRDNGDPGSGSPGAVKRHNPTISFSSPVASIIQDAQLEDSDSLDGEMEPSDVAEKAGASPVRNLGLAGAGKPALKNGGHGTFRSHNRGSSRRAQTCDLGFVPRPVSRIDEQDEDSTVELPHHENNQLSIIGETSVVSHKTPNDRHTNLSFILDRTPGNGAGALSVRGEDSAVIGQNVGKLSLSPLSEFTLNNSDQSFGFEVSYVMGNRHMKTGDGAKKVMSMTIRDLVGKLSEVEPFEPYWEDLTELDLQDKRLTSLHMLNEFCGKIVTLDVSRNALGHLDGVPATVRQLKVSQNMLTELTSWDHLANLQYVDVSGNEIKSLSALKGLVHLRSIKADDNKLTSLDGLDCHDGLLSLRARDNLIEDVDFATLQLNRLTELDLEGNQIHTVRNLRLLPELSRLRLSRNRLTELALESSMKTLRQLDISDNELTGLDISELPGVRSLHADRNYITDLRGFSRARRLDGLSLREQRGEKPLDLNFLSAACEIRKLFLSGNYLGTFEPRVDFLNLQLLELANCGLGSLPENLGQLMPNLRTLNLNFNAIPDLSPLRFIPRLKKLLAAGNRLADSTAATELLTDFAHLTHLDLRDNPVTLGFYAPLQVVVSRKDGPAVGPFVLPDADVERDKAFIRRLDEPTRLRRRLHQVVFVASCRRLRTLDGLPIKRHDVLARDDALRTLIAEGMLPHLDGGEVDAEAADEAESWPRPEDKAPAVTGAE